MKTYLFNSIPAALGFCLAMFVQSATAQPLILSGTNYFQNFDDIGNNFPPEWAVYTGATSTSAGTLAAVNTGTTILWSTTSFQFANYASVTNNDGTPFTGNEDADTQAACTNRALGVRTTSSNDPGDAFVLKIDNTLGFANFQLDVDFLLLFPTNRANVWTVDYGFGSTPGNFTPADTNQNYTANTIAGGGVFGATHRTISFGHALDNNPEPVWIRIVNLTPSVSSGGASSRPTVGIDNFSLSYNTNISATATPVTFASQPQSLTNDAGTTAIFTVGLNGSSPYTNQWYEVVNGVTNQLFDGATSSGFGTISGSGSQTLTISGVLGSDDGEYFDSVANSVNSTNSTAAILKVNDPAITAQSGNQTNAPGDIDYFDATVTGSQDVDLKWYYNGTLLSDFTTNTGTTSVLTTIYVTNTPAATNLGGYYLVASNAFGMATSAVAVAVLPITPSVEIARWDFNDTNDSTPFNTLTSIGNGVGIPGPNAGVTNFIFANGVLADPNNLVPGATNQAWELDGFPATIENKTAGFQFNVSTVGYKNLMLTWQERHSATASKYMRLQYSTNGVDFVDGDVLTFDQVAYVFRSSNLADLPGVSNNPNFAFRLVAEWESSAIGTGNTSYDGTTSGFGSGGTIRVDLMTLFGDPMSSVSPIPLNIQSIGTNVVLTWNDPSSAFSLQAAPTVNGTYTDVPGATSPYTNAISGSQQYFRLKSN